MRSNLDDIMFIYDRNLGRTTSLIELYTTLTAVKRGRRTTEQLDLLRVSVVLLHSTMEDFIRNLMNWKLPDSSKEKINKVPLFTSSYDPRKTKFELGELLEHSGRTVQEIVELSVREYLNSVSFNNTSDLVKNLSDIQINTTEGMRSYFANLDEMIKRRHNIVHQADRDFIHGSRLHKIKSISIELVQSWQTSVEGFMLEVVSKVY
ncbi:HEPN domain-containing protein [Pedobacter gandavensis]|uniref:HEPN domain-containing protein n=1 Tax=Pedobacter gandavensis TaxID=2679963 RepID=UPI00292F30F9|nr:HEPN domain-containing protein [Pedobacter gandavensis]